MTCPTRALASPPRLRRAAHLIAMMPQKFHLKNTSTCWNPTCRSSRLFSSRRRDEDVLQRFALLRDLQIAVALPPFHLVVVVDEEPIERGMLAEDFFDEQEAAVVIEPAVDARR